MGIYCTRTILFPETHHFKTTNQIDGYCRVYSISQQWGSFLRSAQREIDWIRKICCAILIACVNIVYQSFMD